MSLTEKIKNEIHALQEEQQLHVQEYHDTVQEAKYKYQHAVNTIDEKIQVAHLYDKLSTHKILFYVSEDYLDIDNCILPDMRKDVYTFVVDIELQYKLYTNDVSEDCEDYERRISAEPLHATEVIQQLFADKDQVANIEKQINEQISYELKTTHQEEKSKSTTSVYTVLNTSV